MHRPEKITVLLPKSAFKEDSKNSLATIFKKAGYDKVASGAFDRNDEIELSEGIPHPNPKKQDIIQGDFRFRTVKANGRLTEQLWLYRNSGVGMVMSTDLLGAAASSLMTRRNTRVDLRKVLSLNIGSCSLRFIAPQQNPVRSVKDLEGRQIFSKYPTLTLSTLKQQNITAENFGSEGADTTCRDFALEGDVNTAALEIVQSGETARKAGLDISDVFPEVPGYDFDFSHVTTDYWVSEMSKLTDYVKSGLISLGISLESAMQQHNYDVIEFNIPAHHIKKYKHFGISGPTTSKIASKDGSDLLALKIFAKSSESKATRDILIRMGAIGVGITEKGVNSGITAGDSEVLAAFK